MSKQLLAKTPYKDKELPLDQHLLDTEEAAKAIFQGRVLKNWCRFFRITDPDSFLLHLKIACLFHDIGKANAEFDALVNGNKQFKQTLRHEWISALILHLPSVRSWLEKSELDLEVITAAVLSHHLQASRQDWGQARTPEKDKEIDLYLKHPNVLSILEKIANLAQVEGLSELPEKWVAGAWEDTYKNANRIGAKFSREVKKNETRRGLLLAVKAGLIAADSVASGIFRIEGSEGITQWVEETLHRDPITRKDIEDKILQPRYSDIEKKSGNSFKLKPFQEKATELSSRLLLLSGCGTGKTIFAYKWMQGVLENHEAGHVVFLYPTRGTATEGFKDYVSWAPESDASLLTGTALYDLKGMRENPSESVKGKNYTTDERLYALGFWGKRFFSATVDQFLSFLTHSYSGICLLPVLADSVVVIDEVHSFDRGMFNHLVSFLEHFNIPVLCMTATLPTTRRKDLTDKLEKKGKGLGLEIFPTEEDRSQLEELEKAETRPRYIIQFTSYKTAYTQAIEAYRAKKRVLWVVNTVDRCRKTANQLEDDLKSEVLTYHSQFRLKDRQNRHSETISAFQGKGEAAIAVTTQVCEMSLDLDADVLITELAPISALVQRFGRSNRSHNRKTEERANIWVYEPEKNLPYKNEELAKAKEFIKDVSSFKEVSQRILAEKLKYHSPKEDFADGSSGFVTGGYWATSEPFRDINDYSVSAILDSDLEAFLKLREAKNPDAEGLIISIPEKSAYEPEHRPENLPHYLKLADHTKYCTKRGFGE